MKRLPRVYATTTQRITLTSKESEMIRLFETSTKRKIKEITVNIKNDPENWIVSTEDDLVSFKPLKVDNYAEKTLFQYADKVLFIAYLSSLLQSSVSVIIGLSFNTLPNAAAIGVNLPPLLKKLKSCGIRKDS